MKKNLLKETLQALKDINRRESDVRWVGGHKTICSWEEFKKIADIEYNDSNFVDDCNPNLERTPEKIDSELVIVGDTWWLQRDFPYDGPISHWNYYSLPFKPTEQYKFSKEDLFSED